MTRLLLCTLLLLGACLPAPAVADVAVTSVTSDIQRYLDTVVSSGVPGIAVVVTRGDDVLVTVGRGAAPAGAVDADTRFRSESLSKAFTATAVLQLVERGLVDLDQPVSTYLAEFRTTDPRSDDITVRQLLNQSSGLTDRTLGFNQYDEGPTTPAEAVALLRHSRLAYAPGSSWDYCNPNYWIAARLVEVVSGESFAGYLENRVFEPLGMHDTDEYDVPAYAEDTAPAHAYVFGRAVRVDVPVYYAGGSGGVVTTANDLGIWLRFQHGFTQGGQRAEVLGASMLDELHRRQSPLREYSVGYALGWWSGDPADGGISRVSHSGTGPGATAYAGLFPSGTGVGVLVNASQPRADLLANDLYAMVSGDPVPAPPVAPTPWVDAAATLVVLALGTGVVRGAARARSWAGRGRLVSRVIVVVGLFVLAVALWCVPLVGSRIAGREATWTVLWHFAPLPTVAVALCCALLAILGVVRTVAVVQTRNTSPEHGRGA